MALCEEALSSTEEKLERSERETEISKNFPPDSGRWSLQWIKERSFFLLTFSVHIIRSNWFHLSPSRTLSFFFSHSHSLSKRLSSSSILSRKQNSERDQIQRQSQQQQLHPSSSLVRHIYSLRSLPFSSFEICFRRCLFSDGTLQSAVCSVPVSLFVALRFICARLSCLEEKVALTQWHTKRHNKSWTVVFLNLSAFVSVFYRNTRHVRC